MIDINQLLSKRNYCIYPIQRSVNYFGDFDKLVKKFDKISPGTKVGERGRDCSLYTNGKSTGLIQCKRLKENLTPKEVGEEVIKFCLHAIIDKKLIADKKNFTYFLAVSKGFTNPASSLIDEFNVRIFEEKDYENWVKQVIRQYAGLKHLVYEDIKDDLKEILETINLIPIYPIDINGWLAKYPNIVKEFFSIPEEMISNKLSLKFMYGFASLVIILLTVIAYQGIPVNNTLALTQINDELQPIEERLITDSIPKPVFEKRNDVFKILLLPFNPDNNCTIQDTDYEGQLLQRYNELKERDSLNIDVQLSVSYDCPKTNKEAQKIGVAENADIVIWGHYDETCKGKIKVRLRHTLIREDFDLDEKKEGDSDSKVLIDLSELRRGYLQEDIDYIFQWSLADIDYDTGKFNEGIERLFALQKNDCNVNLLLKIIDGYEALEELDTVLELYQRMFDCHQISDDLILNDIGMTYAKQKDYENAIRYLKKSIFYQNRPYSLHDLIEVYFEAKKDSLLYDFLDDLLNTEIPQADIHYYKGIVYEKHIDTLKSLSHYNKTIEIDSSYGNAYQKIAEIAINRKQYDKAKTILNEYLNINPIDKFWTAYMYYHLSKVSILENNLESALVFIDKALEIDSMESLLYETRGDINMAKKEFSCAVEDYTKYIQLFPYWGSYEKRIKAYKKLQEYDKALNDYDEMIEREPNHLFLYSEAIEFCEKINKKEKLEYYHRQITKLKTQDKHDYWRKKNSYVFLKQYDNAIQSLNKLIEIEPKQTHYYSELFHLYMLIPDTLKAINALNRVMEIMPDKVYNYSKLIDLYLVQSDTLKSIETLSKIIKVVPNDLHYYYRRAKLYSEIQDTLKALQDYSTIIQLDSSKSEGVYNMRGIYYSDIGEYDKAIADFDSALLINPENSIIRNNKYIVEEEKIIKEDPVMAFVPRSSAGIVIWTLLLLLLSSLLFVFKEIAFLRKYVFIQKEIKKLRDEKKEDIIFLIEEKHNMLFNKIITKINSIKNNHYMILYLVNFFFVWVLIQHTAPLFSTLCYGSNLPEELNNNTYRQYIRTIAPYSFFTVYFIICLITQKRLCFVFSFTKIINSIFIRLVKTPVTYLTVLFMIMFITSKYVVIYFDFMTNGLNFKLNIVQFEVFYFLFLWIFSLLYLRNLYYLYAMEHN